LNQRLLIVLAAAICARAQNSYSVHGLVSDLPGMADQLDVNLKNPWGLAASGTSPFWISNNRTGTATVYNTFGKPFPDASPIIVTIPSSGGVSGASSPTGQVFNDTGSFELAPGKPALFLFCAEDGAISGWNSSVSPSALKLVDNSGSGAIYKGIAVANTSDGPRLYAANFRAGTIDAFDGAFNPVPTPDELRGPTIPGYAPFNIQRIGQRLYVTYAMQDDDAEDDVPGAGKGYLYVFTLEGHLVSHLIEGGALNAPWGMAVAPEYFGPFSQALLVANFGDGKINAYETCSGQWLGALADTDGKDLVLPGLWALRAGNGHNGGEAGLLYFTAGIPGDGDIESHGLFGSIRPAAPAAPAAPPPPAAYAVDILNLRFTPDAISIPVGGVLTWTNSDGFAHTVKGDATPFASGMLNNKGTFTQTFDTPGTFDYHCTIHPFMRGKVVVQ
jgi:uncharacterized protein (TIGR03118 family)